VIAIQTDRGPDEQGVERSVDGLGVVVVSDKDQLMLITDTGRLIRMGVHDVRIVSRTSKGVRLMRLDDGERVVGMEKVPEGQAEEGASEAASEAPAEAPTEAPDAPAPESAS
jgi:DNA gyrase subunit A